MIKMNLSLILKVVAVVSFTNQYNVPDNQYQDFFIFGNKVKPIYFDRRIQDTLKIKTRG